MWRPGSAIWLVAVIEVVAAIDAWFVIGPAVCEVYDGYKGGVTGE
jgi:hypothetical protein